MTEALRFHVSYYTPFSVTLYFLLLLQRRPSWHDETANDSIRIAIPQCDIVSHNCSLTAAEITDSRAWRAHLSFCRPQKAWHNIGRERQNFLQPSHYVVSSILFHSSSAEARARAQLYTHTRIRVHRLAVLSPLPGKFHHRPCQRQLEYYRASSTTSGNSANRRGKKPLRKTSITLRHR